jgi:hypothetical protein
VLHLNCKSVGKKTEEYSFLIAGIVMMAYPYFAPNLLISLVIGLILCALPIAIKKYL